MKKLIFLLLLPAMVHAQQAGTPFQGFSNNKDKPINFEADRAEVYDSEKKAILIGNVKVIQGESTVTAKKLVLWYESAEESKKSGAKKATGAAEGQSVKKIDMFGDVIVTSKNQRATSDNGVYNVKDDLAILTGNVVLTQCKNVMFGDKLTVYVDKNEAKLDASKNGRVSGVLVSKNNTTSDGGCVGEAAPTPMTINHPNRPPAVQEVVTPPPAPPVKPKPAPAVKLGG